MYLNFQVHRGWGFWLLPSPHAQVRTCAQGLYSSCLKRLVRRGGAPVHLSFQVAGEYGPRTCRSSLYAPELSGGWG